MNSSIDETPHFDPYAMPPAAVCDPPQSLWSALRKIGPGIILAGSIVGSGELIVTTSLGASHGYTFLWLILLSCLIKVFVQIELGRCAIVTGQPTLGVLNRMPGLRWGAHWLVWWWFFMLLATVVQLGGMTAGVGQALRLAFPTLPMSETAWAVATCLLTIGLLWSGSYARIESLTTYLVVAVTGLTVLCVLALQFTEFPLDPSAIWKGLRWTIPANGLMTAFSMFGITGVGATELYAYPYWCLEKGYARYVGARDPSEAWAERARGWIRVMQLDAWASMIVFTVATVAFYFMGAAVLHPQHLQPEKDRMIETLAQMYVGPFGAWAYMVFLIGAGATLFKTLYVSCASHSRLTADFFSLAGFTRFSDEASRGNCIRWLCLGYPLLALAFYWVLGNPQQLVKFGGIAQGLTLPIIGGATLVLRYRYADRRLKPSGFSDICLWVAVLMISAVALVLVFTPIASRLAGGPAS